MTPSPPVLRIVIVDDSELVRAGLHSLLQNEPGLKITGSAATVSDALKVCRELRPDVVLLDMRLPDGTGLDACRTLLQLQPDIRILFLTSSADKTAVDDAVRAGAHGYLLKEIDAAALVRSIHAVGAGQSIMDPAITARVKDLIESNAPATRSVLDALSPQENRVVALIAQGLTNKEVGNAMGLAEKTVKNYLNNVFEKLHVSRRAEAAAIFNQQKERP